MCKEDKTSRNIRRSIQAALAVFFVVFSIACGTDAHLEVIVCETDNPLTACFEDQVEFSVGQKLSVHVVSPEPFTIRQVIGTIKKVTETDTLQLGAQVISLSPEQKTFTQTLPFHDFGAQAVGTFVIEFVDDTNQPIAEKWITIQ